MIDLLPRGFRGFFYGSGAGGRAGADTDGAGHA